MKPVPATACMPYQANLSVSVADLGGELRGVQLVV